MKRPAHDTTHKVTYFSPKWSSSFEDYKTRNNNDNKKWSASVVKGPYMTYWHNLLTQLNKLNMTVNNRFSRARMKVAPAQPCRPWPWRVDGCTKPSGGPPSMFAGRLFAWHLSTPILFCERRQGEGSSYLTNTEAIQHGVVLVVVIWLGLFFGPGERVPRQTEEMALPSLQTKNHE